MSANFWCMFERNTTFTPASCNISRVPCRVVGFFSPKSPVGLEGAPLGNEGAYDQNLSFRGQDIVVVNLVWYGSINLLSFGNAEESIMRLESPNTPQGGISALKVTLTF
jgi:hypothetical protein